METKHIVEQFFAAWTTGNAAAARALMADDMRYEGPLNTYDTADALHGPLMRFATLLRSATMIDVIVDGDRAALLYDCVLPNGTLRSATFQRVANGKIVSYVQAFDPTLLRQKGA